MKIQAGKINVMGMELDRWICESCVADFGTGKNWATLYTIKSYQPGKGHATALLKTAKKYYEDKGLKFGGSVALNERMRSIYKRLKIKEYKD